MNKTLCTCAVPAMPYEILCQRCGATVGKLEDAKSERWYVNVLGDVVDGNSGRPFTSREVCARLNESGREL